MSSDVDVDDTVPEQETADSQADLAGNESYGTSYGGIETFLRAPHESPADLTSDVDVGFVGVPFDGGVTREPGTRHGPSALRESSAWHGRRFHSDGESVTLPMERRADYSEATLRDCGDAPTVPNDIEATAQKVTEYVRAVAQKTMPVVLGGDHYITYPAFRAYAETVGEDVGLIHLDAHSDTSDDSDLYGKHYHGSPMARIDESEYGSYDTHAMIGIRGHSRPSTLEIFEERDIFVDYASDVHRKGIEASVEEAIDHVTAKTDHVYLTLDIDVVDPGFAPGTGTPEHGGLTSDQFLRAVDRLGQCEAIGAADLMEVAPRLDTSNTTSLLGSNALSRFLEAKLYDSVV
jgi:agmatinase